MNYKVVASIAKTHLFSRMRQSIIAALGVTFGIGTFITLVSFMTGLNGLLDGLILNRTPHVHIFNEVKPTGKQPVDRVEEFQESFRVVHSIQPKKNQVKIHNALPMMDLLNKDPRVRGAIPQTTAQVFYLAGSINLNGIINGVDPVDEGLLFSLGDYVVEGSITDLANHSNGILLGAGLADKMSVEVNDRILVSSDRGNQKRLKVVGIYQSGLAEIDDVQSYANIKTAQQLMEVSDSYITNIRVKLHDIEDAPAMAAEITRKYGLNAIDLKSANAQFEVGTTIRNMITYAVSITLLIVAGFGIYNILNMLIYEKMNDIAILKATGFSGNDVQQIFIGQAMIIGLVGGLLGLMIGYLLSVLIDATPFETQALPTIKTFPVNFNPLYYMIGIVFALISTFLAGFLPAKKASKLDPVEIIRKQ